MSVVAFDGKTLASDRMAYDSHKFPIKKILRVGTGLVGVTGGVAHGKQLLDWARNGYENKWPKWEGNADDAAVMLLCYKNEIWYYHCAVPIKIDKKLWAIGSGASVALGAMSAGVNAFRAVELACEYDPYCGMGIDVISFLTD